MLSSVITLFFTPTFILSLRYFEFHRVVIVYFTLAILFLIYTFYNKKFLKDLVVPAIYSVLLFISIFYLNFKLVKFIPVFISMAFFLFFLDSLLGKKQIIYRLMKKYYPKKLTDNEVLFLKNGDLFWVVVTCINVLIQACLAYLNYDLLWAFYTSVGWYIYFFFALIGQVVYGRIYAIMLYSK